MSTAKYRYDVFISYSSKDREFAKLLASGLSDAGLRTWIDVDDLKPGASLAETIDGALKASRVVLIVMSPEYFQSQWTQQEWQYALGRDISAPEIRLVPILYRDCVVPEMLRVIHWADFRDRSQYAVGLARLINDLKGILGNSEVPVRVPDIPKPGERLEQLDDNKISELTALLKKAVDTFSSNPTPSPEEEPNGGRSEVENDLCFIIMPFKVEALNVVFEDYVTPVLVDRCKLRVLRGDDLFGSNIVMDDITKSIRRARLIIADLTGRNPNVFYEIGIAHALNKEVLLMTQSVDDVPFDLRHRRALPYEYTPRGCTKLAGDLYENVQGMLKGGASK